MTSLHRSALSIFGVVVLSVSGISQAQWTQLTPTASPSKRANSHMISDLLAAYVWAGNLSGTVFYNDL